jgi:hypothetical protein
MQKPCYLKIYFSEESQYQILFLSKCIDVTRKVNKVQFLCVCDPLHEVVFKIQLRCSSRGKVHENVSFNFIQHLIKVSFGMLPLFPPSIS